MLCLRILLPFAAALGFLLICRPVSAVASPEVTDKARQFVKDHDSRIRPLDIAAGLAWWNANTTGDEADFKKKEEAQNRIDEALADPKKFAELSALRKRRADIDDPILARCIDVL